MSFKQIFIKNKSYLSYQNNSMHVKNEFTKTLVSLDDINILIIENQQTTLTATLISKMALANISVIFVDDTFTPSAISLGLYKNSRTVKIQKAQVSLNKPRLNRLWKEIIYAKILNQGDVLNIFQEDDFLYGMMKKITSGDRNNVEAICAAHYFVALFGKDFCRKDKDDNRNIALNYGYSIIRSSIARYIVAYGLNPSFGMWHSSELNAFNLADDLIEPFRAIVDRYVVANISKEKQISSIKKQELVGLLYTKVYDSHKQVISVNEAIKNIVSSYQSFCLHKREDIEICSLIKN